MLSMSALRPPAWGVGLHALKSSKVREDVECPRFSVNTNTQARDEEEAGKAHTRRTKFKRVPKHSARRVF